MTQLYHLYPTSGCCRQVHADSSNLPFRALPALPPALLEVACDGVLQRIRADGAVAEGASAGAAVMPH